MTTVLYAKTTKLGLDSFAERPRLPLLIIGQGHSSKQSPAYIAAAKLVSLHVEEVIKYPYLYEIIADDPDRSGIDIVRQIKLKLSLSVTGAHAPKILLIISVDKLSHEAQNALLKTLEEPPKLTFIILTADSRQNVLPTIISRTQTVDLLPIDFASALNHYQSDFGESSVKKAWEISRGDAILLYNLLTFEGDHSITKGIEMAKEFLKLDRYGRINYIEKHANTRILTGQLLDGLTRILASLQKSAIAKNQPNKKLLENGLLISNLIEILNSNAAVRLVGLKLALKFKG